MSVVAVKVTDKYIDIASDSGMWQGWTQEKGDRTNLTKLNKVKDMIIGWAGSAADGTMLNLFAKTHTPMDATEDALVEFMAEFFEWKYKKTAKWGINLDTILIFKNKAFFIEDTMLVSEIHSYNAIGAGMDFALASLYNKSTVDKAVETACHLSAYCELPLIKYRIKKSK